MPTFSAEALRHVARVMLEALGTPPDSAQVVGDALVEANLVGHDSHGVIRLIRYAEFVRQGYVKPAARPLVSARNRATAQVDGRWGWGQLAARLATRTVMELATEYGTGAVSIAHCNHVGRLGEYVETMAHAGMVGLALCNTARSVAPYGGRQRVMGTNPLAWAAPRGPGQEPLLVDFATATVAEGKLRVALAKGERIAPGLLLDPGGRPSQEPADFYAGGALLAFGGHKGYGISVMIELLGRAIAGINATAESSYRGFNGTILLALNIPDLMPMEQFIAAAEALCAEIKSSTAAQGFSEVLLPGEPEIMTRRGRLSEGISLPEQTWADIQALARELGAPL